MGSFSASGVACLEMGLGMMEAGDARCCSSTWCGKEECAAQREQPVVREQSSYVRQSSAGAQGVRLMGRGERKVTVYARLMK